MKLYLLSILMLISTSVWAEWEYTDTDKASQNEYFYDFETLRKVGNLRWIDTLVNLKSIDKDGWVSVTFRDEIDCENQTYQTISSMVFSEKFARGKVLRKFDSPSIKGKVIPDTVGWTGLHKVCNR
jgi:hypothetical protein